MDILAQMSWGQWILAVLLLAVCCFLILVVLIQRGRGGGLAGAFGGAGGSSAFGAKTGDVFTWITVGVATLFVVLNVLSNYAFDQSPQPIEATPATATPPTPVTATDGTGEPITVTTIEIPPAGPQDAAPSSDEAIPPSTGDEEQPSP